MRNIKRKPKKYMIIHQTHSETSEEAAEADYLITYNREFSIMKQAGYSDTIPRRSLLNLYQNNLFPYRHQQLFAAR